MVKCNEICMCAWFFWWFFICYVSQRGKESEFFFAHQLILMNAKKNCKKNSNDYSALFILVDKYKRIGWQKKKLEKRKHKQNRQRKHRPTKMPLLQTRSSSDLINNDIYYNDQQFLINGNFNVTTNSIEQQRHRQQQSSSLQNQSSSSSSWLFAQMDRKTLSIIYTVLLYYSFIAVVSFLFCFILFHYLVFTLFFHIYFSRN